MACCSMLTGTMQAPTGNNLRLMDGEFERLRDALNIPRDFPADVLAAAQAASQRKPSSPEYAARFADLQSIPFVTIDPPTSRDLDQAFCAVRKSDGWLVHYAIDDLAFFVDRGGLIEAEAWRRGLTLYSPDLRTPLYPSQLSEDAASLLPDAVRPAVVFTFSLNARAEVERFTIARALIRSRAKLSYPEVTQHLERESASPGSGALAGHEWSASLTSLSTIGRARQQLEAARGGISLRIPTQQVERWTTALSGYRLAFELSSEVEEWNAQISLMTGMASAQMMIAARVGLLRALDPPRADRVHSLRLTAAAIGVNWPATMDYDDFVRSLDPHNPLDAVMLHQAARVTGGARYVAFEGELPKQALHSAIAAPYAHVTAPLRRLADRYVLDLLIELAQGRRPAPAEIAELHRLPKVMAEAEQAARRLESMIVDYAEALLMKDRAGEIFQAVIIALRDEGLVVQITDPPIRTLVPAAALSISEQKLQPVLSPDGATLSIGNEQFTLGQTIRLRLESASPATRSLQFSLVH